ncbi:MAG: 50S ribosomal protein L24 [Candidatus Wallbacteria bacterium]|nr:50S ribosomal protein L24 [Candidatus Wallbacteria bacterium]
MENKTKVRIRKDDMVMVQTGKDKGKIGKVLSVLQNENKVIVTGVNMVKRHQKANKQHRHGGIIEKEGPIFLAKVMLVCPKCNLPTKIGHKLVNEVKVRICKKCEEIVDNV